MKKKKKSCMVKVWTYVSQIIRKVLPTISWKFHWNDNGRAKMKRRRKKTRRNEKGSPKQKSNNDMCNMKSIVAADTWFYCISNGLMWFMIRVICIGGNATHHNRGEKSAMCALLIFTHCTSISSNHTCTNRDVVQTAICINLLPMDLFKLSGC